LRKSGQLKKEERKKGKTERKKGKAERKKGKTERKKGKTERKKRKDRKTERNKRQIDRDTEKQIILNCGTVETFSILLVLTIWFTRTEVIIQVLKYLTLV
jgi:hypothetical protein